jgi:hypothetical protein
MFLQHLLGGMEEIHKLKSCDVFSTEEGPPLSTKEVRTMTILRELPFLVAFQERVLVFQSLVLKDKAEHQGEHSHFLQGPNIQVAVRRNYLYEDAFDKLSPENGKPTISVYIISSNQLCRILVYIIAYSLFVQSSENLASSPVICLLPSSFHFHLV